MSLFHRIMTISCKIGIKLQLGDLKWLLCKCNRILDSTVGLKNQFQPIRELKMSELCQNLGTQPFILSLLRLGLFWQNNIKTIQVEFFTKLWDNHDFFNVNQCQSIRLKSRNSSRILKFWILSLLIPQKPLFALLPNTWKSQTCKDHLNEIQLTLLCETMTYFSVDVSHDVCKFKCLGLVDNLEKLFGLVICSH